MNGSTLKWYRFLKKSYRFPVRNTKWLKNCKLRRAILSAFYNISQRNVGILIVLWCSFKLWWNVCLDLSRSKRCSLGNRSIRAMFLKNEANNIWIIIEEVLWRFYNVWFSYLVPATFFKERSNNIILYESSASVCGPYEFVDSWIVLRAYDQCLY
jgi:hypothetical protein